MKSQMKWVVVRQVIPRSGLDVIEAREAKWAAVKNARAEAKATFERLRAKGPPLEVTNWSGGVIKLPIRGRNVAGRTWPTAEVKLGYREVRTPLRGGYTERHARD